VRLALGNGSGVLVVVTGIGQDAARAAAAEWVPQVRAVVVCGVAGGTGGAAGAGDVVVASGLFAGHGVSLPGVTPLELPGTVFGLVASVDAPVDSASARAALLAEGVVAIEMEAAGWAAVCGPAHTPLIVVRGVLDTPDTPLGAAASLLRPGDRGPGLATIVAMALRPRDWSALRRTQRAATLAEKRTAEVAAGIARGL